MPLRGYHPQQLTVQATACGTHEKKHAERAREARKSATPEARRRDAERKRIPAARKKGAKCKRAPAPRKKGAERVPGTNAAPLHGCNADPPAGRVGEARVNRSRVGSFKVASRVLSVAARARVSDSPDLVASPAALQGYSARRPAWVVGEHWAKASTHRGGVPSCGTGSGMPIKGLRWLA